MIYGLIVLLVIVVICFQIIDRFGRKFPGLDRQFLRQLALYHFALAFVYYLYAVFNPSDSHFYYIKVTNQFRGESWIDYYATSTGFIEFVGYPFVNFLGFSYEAIMVLFAF